MIPELMRRQTRVHQLESTLRNHGELSKKEMTELKKLRRWFDATRKASVKRLLRESSEGEAYIRRCRNISVGRY